MRRAYSLALPILFLLISCQPQSKQTITIIDGNQIHQLTTAEHVPASLLTQADIHLAANDIVLLNGKPVALNQPMPTAQTYTLQVRHAVAMTVNGKTFQTTAQTIGEALSQAGAQLYASDQINPPIQTPITGTMTVKYIPSRALIGDGRWHANCKSAPASATVGGALAEAGIPLLGLDSSQPSENEALPSNGQIQVTRISESILLSEKSIPFKTDYQQSADVELDQQKILQPGQLGLSVSRVRIVYEDGQEASRQNESENRGPRTARSNRRLRDKGCDPYHNNRWRSDSILARGANVCHVVFALRFCWGGRKMLFRHIQRPAGSKRRGSRKI